MYCSGKDSESSSLGRVVQMIPIMEELGATAEKAFQSAHQMLADFHRSPPAAVINEAIDLLKPSLVVLQAYGAEADEIRSIALFTLAKAQYARFHLSEDLSDLLDATSCLEKMIGSRPERDIAHPLDYTVDGLFYIMMSERAHLNYDEEIANILQSTEEVVDGAAVSFTVDR